MKQLPHSTLHRCKPLEVRTSGPRQQAGAASLIVVMVLFFLMSLVAAYTSRNLIFEQRTSVNQYRSTQAYEAAEAGLEWALTMLNSGRIGADCLETGATTAETSFRQRYLNFDANTGVVTERSRALWPSCVSDGAGGWTCSCPSSGSPSLSPPSGNGVFPAFRVRFTSDELTRPGLIRIESNGCTKLDDACLNHPAVAQNLEGRANVAAIVALTSALPTPPGASLSVLGNAPLGSILTLYNTDVDFGGITVQAGGTVDYTGWTLRSVPGTPGSASVVQIETSLSALSAAPDRAFASVFSMWPVTYRTQQSTVVVNCPAPDCRADLATAVSMNPDRVIWATTADPTGTITLASPGTIGSAPDPTNTSVAGPAVIVFDRPLNVTAAGVSLFGFVYSRGGNWQGSSPLEVQGAAYVGGELATTARATVVMNSAVLRSLRLRSGSFVRAPGGWDDFRGRAP